ncbi:MAG: ribonuclease HII [Thermoplasmatota archaeon]
MIGVDEAGRGPVLGPIVVALLQCRQASSLLEQGVRDSKRLSPDVRNGLYEKLTTDYPYCIVEMGSGSIDISRREMTMNRLETLLFATAISSFMKGEAVIHPGLGSGLDVKVAAENSWRPRRIYLDAADVNEERFAREIKNEVSPKVGISGIDFISKHKGDDIYPVVGGASIIAKVTRDRRIEELSRTVGRDIGSGYPSDPRTIHFMEGWLEETGELPPFARASWETSKKLLAKLRQKDLGDY